MDFRHISEKILVVKRQEKDKKTFGLTPNDYKKEIIKSKPINHSFQMQFGTQLQNARDKIKNMSKEEREIIRHVEDGPSPIKKKKIFKAVSQ